MTEPYSLAAQKSGLGYRILRAIKRDKLLFLMFLPIFAYYIIFNYIPMTGAIISFKQFRPGGGIYNGDWVGLKWFIQFFESPFAYRTIRNTVLISFYSILFGFPMPILFAVCVMEIRHNKARRMELPLELRQRGIHLREQFIVTHAFLLPYNDDEPRGGLRPISSPP